MKLALEMLNAFSREAMKCSMKPFSFIAHGPCMIKKVDEAKTLLLKVIAEGAPPGNAVFNSVVNGYS